MGVDRPGISQRQTRLTRSKEEVCQAVRAPNQTKEVAISGIGQHTSGRYRAAACCGALGEGIMASGHVNRTNRPNTWLHRPACKREEKPCPLGAVHTWHKDGVIGLPACG